MDIQGSTNTMSDLPIIHEKMSMDTIRGVDLTPPVYCLVKDFGWPSTSPRYRGDHTQESNPDWDYNPLECIEAREEAMRKMEASYKIYMANMGQPVSDKKSSDKKDSWTRFVMPWRWTLRREVTAA